MSDGQGEFTERLWRFFGGRDGRSGHHGATLDDVAALVAGYYGFKPNGRLKWTGASSDTQPTADPARFVEEDRRALGWLSVRMAKRDFAAVVGNPDLDLRLAEVPLGLALWDADARSAVEDASFANLLWRDLCRLRGFGWVSSHKLLAYKRPQLLPVYDRVVKRALKPPDRRWWLPLWEALQDKAMVSRLEEMKKGATAAPVAVSLLRVLDVAVWRTQMLLDTPSEAGTDRFAAWLSGAADRRAMPDAGGSTLDS